MFYIDSTDGVKIAVYDYNPCGKKTVFLVHGWPLSHQIYEYQIGPLVECGYRVVSNDLAMIQHRYIKNSRLYQLEHSGHGIMYDELERFNQIFLNSL